MLQMAGKLVLAALRQATTPEEKRWARECFALALNSGIDFYGVLESSVKATEVDSIETLIDAGLDPSQYVRWDSDRPKQVRLRHAFIYFFVFLLVCLFVCLFVRSLKHAR